MRSSRGRGERASEGQTNDRAASHSAPGKRTLTEGMTSEATTTPDPAGAQVSPVQRQRSPGALDDQGVHAAAATGMSGPSTSLPYLGLIQRAFGRHDVSGIAAHTDDN